MVTAQGIKKAAAKSPWLPLFLHHLVGSFGTSAQPLEERIVAQVEASGIKLSLHFRPFDEWEGVRPVTPKLRTQVVKHYLVVEATGVPELLSGSGTVQEALTEQISFNHAQSLVECKEGEGNLLAVTIFYFGATE